MLELVLIWLGLLIALIAFAAPKAKGGGALIVAYFLGLSLIHLPGALLFLIPQPNLSDARETEIGFTLTVIGMAAFVAGAIYARATYGGKLQAASKNAIPVLAPYIWPLIFAGFIFYFVLMPLAGRIPSGTSLVSSLGALLIIGIWLRFYTAALAANTLRMMTTLMLLPLLPVATLAGTGFVNFGIYWALSCIAFLFVIARTRLWFYLSAPVGGVLGLSFFAVYLILRSSVRVLVTVQAGLSDVLLSIQQMFDNFQLLDLSSPLLAYAVDARLNQNYLVGLAAERYQFGDIDLAYGSTVQLWAFIPRALWPDKPQIGGGLDVVSNFTGLVFSPDTSVGVGQVMEFYMNFGMPGLILGFFILGFILMRLDLRIMEALQACDMRKLLLYALPGLALMQPGGNLLEILVAAVGAMVSSRLLGMTGIFDSAASANPADRPVPQLAE